MVIRSVTARHAVTKRPCPSIPLRARDCNETFQLGRTVGGNALDAYAIPGFHVQHYGTRHIMEHAMLKMHGGRRSIPVPLHGVVGDAAAATARLAQLAVASGKSRVAAIRQSELLRIDLLNPARAQGQVTTAGIAIIIQGPEGTEPKVLNPLPPLQIEHEAEPERAYEQETEW
jgi:hypothetical protein